MIQDELRTNVQYKVSLSDDEKIFVEGGNLSLYVEDFDELIEWVNEYETLTNFQLSVIALNLNDALNPNEGHDSILELPSLEE